MCSGSGFGLDAKEKKKQAIKVSDKNKRRKQAIKISDKKERKNSAMKKFNVSHNSYRNFKEIEKLPKIGDNYDGRKVIEINEVGMDCEQPFDDNFNYDLYEIVCEDEDVDTVERYVCVRKEGLE